MRLQQSQLFKALIPNIHPAAMFLSTHGLLPGSFPTRTTRVSQNRAGAAGRCQCQRAASPRGRGCGDVPAAEGDGQAPSPAAPRAPSLLRSSAAVCGLCVTSFVWGRSESQLLQCENCRTCSNSTDLC